MLTEKKRKRELYKWCLSKAKGAFRKFFHYASDCFIRWGEEAKSWSEWRWCVQCGWPIVGKCVELRNATGELSRPLDLGLKEGYAHTGCLRKACGKSEQTGTGPHSPTLVGSESAGMVKGGVTPAEAEPYDNGLGKSLEKTWMETRLTDALFERSSFEDTKELLEELGWKEPGPKKKKKRRKK